MMNTIKKRCAVLLAVFILAIFCCPAVFAVDWDTSLEPGIAEATDAEATNYAVIAKTSGTQNEIGSTIMLVGVGFIAVGGIGLLCLIVWQVVSRRRDRGEDEREDVFEEIQQAEALSRRRRAAEEQRAAVYEEEMPQTAPAQKKRYDPYSVTGEIPLVPARTEHTAERPLVPSTPAGLQQNSPRAPVAPKPTAPVAPVTPKPVTQAAPAARKFDLDDILREVRESKQK